MEHPVAESSKGVGSRSRLEMGKLGKKHEAVNVHLVFAGVYKMFWGILKILQPNSKSFSLLVILPKNLVILPKNLMTKKKKGHQSSVNPPFLNCQPSCKPSFFLHFPSFSLNLIFLSQGPSRYLTLYFTVLHSAISLSSAKNVAARVHFIHPWLCLLPS